MGMEKKSDYTEGIENIDIGKISARVLKEQEEKGREERNRSKLQELQELIEKKGIKINQEVIIGGFVRGIFLGIDEDFLGSAAPIKYTDESGSERRCSPDVIEPISEDKE